MSGPRTERVTADGKFFRLGSAKFPVKGVTYGPFAPNPRGETFPVPAQTERDLSLIRELGANLIRVYYVPPRWFLDLAEKFQLKVFVDIPWPTHLCFLESAELRRQARETVRQAVAETRGHPAVFAYSVANEIPAEIVRWSGVERVEEFLGELVSEAKSHDPECLCTFTNFPPTEFLNVESADFASFNVYLHDREAFERYLARLQMVADAKPLLLAELGMDSLREGVARQSEYLSWQIESVFHRGLAGAIVFSFTDDWFRGGRQIEDWSFGLTTRTRQPKKSFHTVRQGFTQAPYFPLPGAPKISVVVASYNGAPTLRSCLASLDRLHYPNYEVILVDDGSTDDTPLIAADFPKVRAIRHETNQGLSAARNTGIAAATGEIVAFTDADCRADEDWLHYLARDFAEGGFAGLGGHNFLPPEDSLVAAAVMVSPGGPAHVMLTDREAEHIPGCNMAFYRRALNEIGGFDPIFRKAGDDVDVCWRLQQRGHKIGFSPPAFVWHYRRSTVRAYLRQQNGYGEAEALLQRKHPEYFNRVGRGIWNGRIYSASKFGVLLRRSVIYHGSFGHGLFQRLYSPSPAYALMLATSLEYHALVTAPLVVASLVIPWLWPLALAGFALSVGVCATAAIQADLPKRKRRFWSRPLVALLFFLQPIERGLARYRSQLRFRPGSDPALAAADPPPRPADVGSGELVAYWSPGSTSRFAFLKALLARLQQKRWQFRSDSGWTDYDLEIYEAKWSKLRLITTSEYLDQGRLNLRCRLHSFWSFPAKALFWGMLAVELVVCDQLSHFWPWTWMLLLTVPIAGWFIEYQQTRLRFAVTRLLDEVATDQNFVRLQSRPAETQPSAGAVGLTK